MIFVSVFISDIGLQFSFFVISLSGFGIKTIPNGSRYHSLMVASENEFGNVLPPKFFGSISEE